MAHGHNPIIKREIDCGNASVNKSQINSQSVSVAAAASSVGNINSSGSCGGGNNPPLSGGNTKMGSRRIFTPQFKLQVLESYRNDSDCKGNQRATARKYGIHRRQIQKWLQCESNLKSSVANSNQNNVRHQFHNISHHQMTVSSAGATHTSNSSNHHNQQYNSNVLSLDTARHSVALPPPTIGTAAVAAATVATRAPPTTTKCINGLNIATNAPTNLTNTITILPPHKINLAATVLTHTPAIPSVPLIQHHHHHHHQQQQQQQQHHQHGHHQQHENLLMPSACLPLPGSPVQTATNRTHEFRDYQPIIASENLYMNENYRNQQIYENPPYYSSTPPLQQSPDDNGPIDLSLGTRRRDYSSSTANVSVRDDNSDRRSNNYDKLSLLKLDSWQEIENNNNSIKKERQDDYECLSDNVKSTQAVGLTCRKRKNSVYVDETSPPEKVQKIVDSNNDGIAVAIEQQKQSSNDAKPVILFKPYLDDNDKEKKSSNCDQKDPIIWSHHPACLTSPGYESQSSRSSNFQSPNDAYTFPIGSPQTFQSQLFDRITPPSTGSAPSPITSVNSPLACTTTFWCPKGSPVSGYDTASTYSDSSEYHHPQQQHHLNHYTNHHQSQYNHHHYNHHPQTYSVDLKMQVIDSYYHDMTCRGNQIAVAGKYNVHCNEVQRWLDQETDIRISGKELPIISN